LHKNDPKKTYKGGGDKLLEKELTQHRGWVELGVRSVLRDEEKNSSASTGV